MAAPAGWYKTESDEGNLRYWDGQAWTDEVRPDPAAQADLSATTDAPEPSKPKGLVKRSWRWLMHRRLWVRLVAFGVSAFVWGLTGAVAFLLFLLTALLAAWCIHGGVRRRSTSGEVRPPRRRVIVGLLVTVGLLPLLVVTLGPGSAVREQVDTEYRAYRAATRQADAVRASEKARVQASEEAAAGAAQASEEAAAAAAQASEEAQAARVQASEEAQAARTQASEEAAAAAQASEEAQAARADASEAAVATRAPDANTSDTTQLAFEKLLADLQCSDAQGASQDETRGFVAFNCPYGDGQLDTNGTLWIFDSSASQQLWMKDAQIRAGDTYVVGPGWIVSVRSSSDADTIFVKNAINQGGQLVPS